MNSSQTTLLSSSIIGEEPILTFGTGKTTVSVIVRQNNSIACEYGLQWAAITDDSYTADKTYFPHVMKSITRGVNTEEKALELSFSKNQH
eukprot:12723232-Ditylum_brightwellii.AAC.1